MIFSSFSYCEVMFNEWHAMLAHLFIFLKKNNKLQVILSTMNHGHNSNTVSEVVHNLYKIKCNQRKQAHVIIIYIHIYIYIYNCGP